MGLDLGIDALVGTGEERIALFDFGVDAPVAAGPVRVLAKETNAARNENLHDFAFGIIGFLNSRG